jgi:Fringe-like
MKILQNSLINRCYSILSYPLLRTTSPTSRRIFNIACLFLFLLALFWICQSSLQTELLVPTTGLYTGDVYYISKRSLCQTSLAYERLGVQPIAISKAILRPVLEGVAINADFNDRLEILPNPLINDIVFLDRGLEGKAAELGSNICPLHTVTVLPPRKPVKYSASNVMFGCVVSVDDLPETLLHWKYWARQKDLELFVLIPYHESQRKAEAERLIRETLGRNVHVETAPSDIEPAMLTLTVMGRMRKTANSLIEWFIILAPQTFVTSINNILLALEPHNSRNVLYMGALSESSQQREKFGNFAYGGAGIVLSRPLVNLLIPHRTTLVYNN